MRVLIVNFNLQGLTDAQCRATSEELAPLFSAVPGLIEKTWLADEGSNTYGGVYKFEDQAALDAYLASELWAGVTSSPNFINLTTRTFDAMPRPTEITRGAASYDLVHAAGATA